MRDARQEKPTGNREPGPGQEGFRRAVKVLLFLFLLQIEGLLAYFVFILPATSPGVGPGSGRTDLARFSIGDVLFPNPEMPSDGSYCLANGCHTTPDSGLNLLIAVNGEEVGDSVVVPVDAGDLLEIDFQVLKPRNASSGWNEISLLIAAPDNPPWKAAVGTLSFPEAWTSDTSLNARWREEWDRGDNGPGPLLSQWKRIVDKSGWYYLGDQDGLRKFSSAEDGAVDSGNPEFPGAFLASVGSDALISVPESTGPGTYSIELYGLGRNADRRLTYVRRTVLVQVGGSPPPSARSDEEDRRVMGSRNLGPPQLYQRYCAGCHGAAPQKNLAFAGVDATRRVISEGRGSMSSFGRANSGHLSEEQITGIVGYLIAEARSDNPYTAPKLRHNLEGKSACLQCHGAGGPVPAGLSHSGKTESTCTSHHMVPPQIPHPQVGRSNCTSCHGGTPLLQLARTHEGRGNGTCLSCHDQGVFDERPVQLGVVPTKSSEPPRIPHLVKGREACFMCHGSGGWKVMPPNHGGYDVTNCAQCHRPR